MSEILVNTIKKADGTGSLTVPADTGTVLTSASTLSSSNLSGALPALDGSSLTGVGVTEVETWRLTSSFSGPSSPITSNLAKTAYSGTGMTESSGVFTFPSTGIWKIDFHAQFRISDNTDRSWVAVVINDTTNNGSSWGTLAIGESFLYTWVSSTVYMKTMTSGFFTVSDTSTDKVRFGTAVEGNSSSVQTDASTGTNYTAMHFIRLGDA